MSEFDDDQYMVLTDVIYTMPHQGKSNSGAFWALRVRYYFRRETHLHTDLYV